MPRVPRYERQVSEQPMPSMDASMAPSRTANIDAFGGGSSQDRLNQATNKLVKQYVDQANDVAFNEASTKATEAFNNSIYGEGGLISYKGRDSINGVEEVGEAFKKQLDDIEKPLSTNNQRMRFQIKRANLATAFNNYTQKYQHKEITRWDEEKFKVGLKTRLEYIDLNYSEPNATAESIIEGEISIAEFGDRNGWSPEQVKLKKMEYRGVAYTAVIGNLLEKGDHELALEAFENIKGKLLPKDSIPLQKAVTEGMHRHNAKVTASKVINKGLSLYEAVKEVKQFAKTPEVMEKATDLVKAHYADVKLADEADLNTIRLPAIQKMTEDPKLSIDNVLSPVDKTVIMEKDPGFLKTLAGLRKVNTEEVKAYEKFMALSAMDIAKLDEVGFMKYYAGMTDNQQREANAVWTASRTNLAESKRMLSKTKMAMVALDKNNIKNKKKRSDFLAQVDDWIIQYQVNNGGKYPSKEEIKTEQDRLLIELKEEDWIFDNEKRLYQVEAEEKDRMYFPNIKDIPKAFFERVQAETEAANKKYTNMKVQRAYAAHLRNDIDQYNKVINE